MSPCDEVTTLKMSRNLEASTGGQIGTDSHEQQRVATSRGIASSGKQRTETGKRRGDDGRELSPQQALGTALSRRGSRRAEAPERGAGVAAQEAAEISGTG